ncbi:putative major facilitator, sugar transporter, major facilitator superfamily [Septoria linicola]|nr:putative major facilitator, sugar transporter, major facilitator superfamily [Septoria linicola]
MGLMEKFLPKEDRFAALLLYGMIFSTCFNGYDAGIMTVILADKQFTDYYHIDPGRQGLIATIPWATTGLAQLFVDGMLASWLGRIWALRISIVFMCLGVVVQSVPNTYAVLIVGRLMTGLGFGCVYIATNLYVAECAPKMLRGSFVGTVSQFGYQLGTLIAFWAGYGMSFHTSPYNIAWRVSNMTKGISLERMDAIFGQVDAVEGGEAEVPKAVQVMEGETVMRSEGGGDCGEGERCGTCRGFFCEEFVR